MNIKLVALDMDGTLLDSNKRLPADFMNWVQNHPDIKTVIASGRQYYTLVKDFVPIKDELVYVAENGGFVFEKDKIIYSNEMGKEDICKCLERIEGLEGLTPIVCGAKSAYMNHAEESILREAEMYYTHLQIVEDLYEAALQDTIVKIAIFVERKKAEPAMKHFADIGEPLAAVLSGDSWIDISNQTVNKGIAVAAIQKRYGIHRKEAMAFGDYLNDVGLLENCEESYCMENGHPELKKLAKYVTASNDEDGVMKVLRELQAGEKR